MSDRRPKRRCVAAKSNVPSAIHYVGYVEDGETPEMIMKKFEELERIKQAAEARRQQHKDAPTAPALAEALGTAAAAPDATADAPLGASGAAELERAQQQAQVLAEATGPSAVHASEPQLDEESLLEVFKQTSIFNVRSALANNELLMAGEHNPMRDGDGAGPDVAYGEEDALLLAAGGDVTMLYGSDLEDDERDYLRGFWSDEDFELGGQAGPSKDDRSKGREGKAPRKKGERREGGKPKGPGGASGASRHVLHQVVTQYNRDTNALIRRRIRVHSGGSGGGAAGAPGGLVQVRVPPAPLPLSWGRSAAPYQPPAELPEPTPVPTCAPAPLTPAPQPAAASAPCSDAGAAAAGADAAASAAAAAAAAAAATAAAAAAAAEACRGFEVASLPSFPFGWLRPAGREYTAVLVNAQWQAEGAADAFERGEDVMDRFRALPIPKLCPRGFVMVWVHKGLIHAVCRQLATWGYVYVENLTWVHLTPANAIARQRGAHFCRSHSTLLMFRKEGEGRDIELRHQRNPDVIFDCLRTLPGGGYGVPPEVVSTIETLLPTGKGSFLELWAPRGVHRPGWDLVSEVR